jgi:hypothetical protein
MVMMYDSKFLKHPRKLKMHWLEPFLVGDITKIGAIHLAQLDGTLQPRWVNGIPLKPYSVLPTGVGKKRINSSWVGKIFFCFKV